MIRTKVVLQFPPSKVEEPIIYHLITDYGLVVNILRAAIDPGKQGRMVVELRGEEESISRAFEYLKGLDVGVDPLASEIKIQEDRCMDCSACVPICPTGALEVDRQTWKVSYDAAKCVVCLSCLEICPYRAIEMGFK
ncbi:MAG: 4Fe-4S dicluster domain-containing protein [Deltaproteobacteria bacterium]|nr:4Fe-4S dicluster domain-containing protein [Deltaproteobacteria bacterium]MBW2017448.1 4Fe-4S dicluster domain-containing protein [Deltaproteobacteria bacterium]MBW2129600.1 4Fe-4S dicluster domain-containing protein [Deltaproteobacteria bacterium]MBW2304280.1 4Fe-4S dicluster domain-containing protein [Deltaproteobacteria bacterium]